MNNPPLPLSVIVVAKNAEKTLAACLESIRCNNPAEIIVVDGVSRDHTIAIALRFTSRVFSDEGQGVSAAHQIGLEKAEYPYISFIDADIILPDGALQTMLEELETGQIANIQAKLLPLRADTYWGRAQDQQIRSRQSRVSGGLSACIMPKDIAMSIGFDPAIWIAGDDMDFLYRLKKAGQKTMLSGVSAVHEHRVSLRGLARQQFWYGRAKPALIKKHGPWHADLWRRQ